MQEGSAGSLFFTIRALNLTPSVEEIIVSSYRSLEEDTLRTSASLSCLVPGGI